jgi:hypothetical protein
MGARREEMAKNGILHDYDLKANAEPSAHGQTCVTCGSCPMSFQWSDYSGEGMCRKCGTPYQLKWGSEAQNAEGKYPYLNLNEKWVPIVRRYHEETGLWTYLGTGVDRPGLAEFYRWVDANNAAPSPSARD